MMFKEKFELLKKELDEYEIIQSQIRKKKDSYHSIARILDQYTLLLLFSFSLLTMIICWKTLLDDEINFLTIYFLSALFITTIVTRLSGNFFHRKFRQQLSEYNKLSDKDWLEDFNFKQEEIIENLDTILKLEYGKSIINKYFFNNIEFFINNIKEIHEKILKKHDIQMFINIINFDIEQYKKILLSKEIDWLAEIIGKEELYNKIDYTIDDIIYEQETQYYEIIKKLFYDFLQDEEDIQSIDNFIELKHKIIQEIKENKKIEKDTIIIHI